MNATMEARRSEGRLLLTLRTPQFRRQTNLVDNDLRLFAEESMMCRRFRLKVTARLRAMGSAK
jgi:hypothetical protein